MWHDLAAALALVLVVEGIFPFINPHAVRRAAVIMSEMSDSVLRAAGLVSMLLGLLVLYLINR